MSEQNEEKNFYTKKFFTILVQFVFQQLSYMYYYAPMCLYALNDRNKVFISFKVSCTNINSALRPPPLVRQPLQ